jgi:hypothetical protein
MKSTSLKNYKMQLVTNQKNQIKGGCPPCPPKTEPPFPAH